MMRHIIVFLLVVVGTFIIDQGLKEWAMNAVNGVEYALIMEGSCINLELFYNRGVAFSMLAFLGDNLKWVQLALIVGIIAYVFYEGYLKQYAFAIGLIVGGALGNLYDRFIHEGVVDYVAWHCGFDFAVFNYADVMINLGVALILLMTFLEYRREKKSKA
ncbi:MAG: Lipoprotein signal peptidase (EC [uncultured Sulfurovum sp.]|uniref:Lipoprotein signal peptidase n=1 Tax=uncultured Sulfurovum sp. TaxID=269237 RepID=A0A6S6TQX7_9BACT|nr:MAG: Lipoprotein signal peptidase (EC [uncultured Sulfurovum sp.]